MTTAELWLFGGSFGTRASGVMQVTDCVLSLVMTHRSAMLLMLVLAVNTAALAVRITLLMVERRSF